MVAGHDAVVMLTTSVWSMTSFEHCSHDIGVMVTSLVYSPAASDSNSDPGAERQDHRPPGYPPA